MNCKICNVNTEVAFKVKVLDKYDTEYLQCSNCGFLFAQNPFWLEEAYSNAITLSDTGMVHRNLQFSKITSAVITFCFNENSKFLDFAGGYGLFTRLMRDNGFDFYWMDKYCENLFARGFEHQDKKNKTYELITAFEVFEHLVDPVKELEGIITYGENIIFSTQLLPSPILKPGDWWYYHFEHGQHISFYTHKSLELLAKKFDLHFFSLKGIHFMTRKKNNPLVLRLILSSPIKELNSYYRLKLKSKTESDSNLINKKNPKD